MHAPLRTRLNVVNVTSLLVVLIALLQLVHTGCTHSAADDDASEGQLGYGYGYGYR